MNSTFEKELGKDYIDLDDILGWYSCELHKFINEFAIYDTSINEYLTDKQGIKDSARYTLQLQLDRKCGTLNTTHYTTCSIEWKDKSRDIVTIKSTDDVIENEDDEIFFYGMSYNDLTKAYLNEEYCENEWKIVGIIDVQNG